MKTSSTNETQESRCV